MWQKGLRRGSSLERLWTPALLTAALSIWSLATVLPAWGQGPAASWQTLQTEHFRVHYPAASEAWAKRTTSRLESIRAAVAREVGYGPPQIVDVVIMDPSAQANGSAWPILPWPRMVLWTSPPGPQSVIGHYRDWGELLVVHEEVHLAHLLRPSRNRLERWSGRLLPIGPISRRAPRWLSEGYATYLEGRLTGYGRPHSDLRAVVLRRWAQLGELPSYGRLNSDSQSWRGLSMAYLVGSAYLEWLVERTGPDSLRQLWARMSARQARSFDAAFVGVFGDPPAKLYNRFRAELTYRAIRTELEIAPQLAAGELWQDLSWTSGAPEISPDGDKLAIVLRSKDGPSRLVVWSTAEDPEAEETWQKKRDRLVALDPEDVPAVRSRPLPRDPLFELTDRHGAPPHTPRWIGGSDALLYVRYEPDAAGFLHPDLFRWDLESGRVERLTHGADLREPDPAPSGEWAVAVRQRHGLSQLVRVDLADGSVEPLTAAAVDVVYHRPRIDPSGQRITFVRHQGGFWQLVVRALSNGDETVLSTASEPTRSTVSYPSWSADGASVFAVVGEGGFLDIRRFDVDSGRSHQVTRSHGATLAPAPTPDGQQLFFLRLEADGLDVARLDLTSINLATPEDLKGESIVADAVSLDTVLEPVIRVASVAATTFEEQTLDAPKPYRAGRQELFPLLGGSVAPSGHGWEAGVRLGDLVGRLDTLALVGGGEGAPRGGAVASSWRGWAFPKNIPFNLAARLFVLEEQPSEQPTTVPGLGRGLDLERQGLEVTGEWTQRRRGSTARLTLGVTLAEIEPMGAEAITLDQSIGFLRFGHRARQAVGAWRFGQQLDLMADWGRTDGDRWRRAGGRIRLTVGRESGSRLGVTWRRRSAEHAIYPFDRLQLGGVADSLSPRSVLGGRLVVSALPVGIRLGDEYEGQRLDLRSSRWPVTFFYERHRLWQGSQAQEDWIMLRGVELSLRREPMPLLRLPALGLRVGVAEILDEPLKDQWEGWLSLAWTP